MSRYLFLCMLFPLLTPGLLSAQRRWLRGQVVRIGEHGEDIPEVNIRVEVGEQDAVTTNSAGRFRVQLRSIFRPGEKVRFAIEKLSWHIRYPLDGEARIPADPDKKPVKVELLPVGSKLFWTHDRIEKFISDMAEKSK